MFRILCKKCQGYMEHENGFMAKQIYVYVYS